MGGLASELGSVINRERSARGLAPLVVNAALTRAAENYAVLSYSQPDPFKLNHNLNGNVGDRARAEGYYGAVGEVLAIMPGPSAEGMVQLWLNSPGHAAILLSGSYREIGIGCAQGPYAAPGGGVWQIALCSGVTGG
jgi:uncharacterized protein YkwD